ncbi:AraC family transcriptional regulator [Pseudovibrio sp. Tun.PSC04-5.I4]|uniref:AraC family transcriptional regulator n=1 Tax=Pseudovibrio sp. Tun.PSC04-5.I4 TaxID=1798213 RepID=UPI00087E5D2D|nr:AraC family transcriptional regulator [Pseudovibrio sp. Tun.PSC04-5.I4]SDQ31857.1 AraC-type DNA-binding protein [Pseudovibrio sp. Tun.PSC04-5.I4]
MSHASVADLGYFSSSNILWSDWVEAHDHMSCASMNATYCENTENFRANVSGRILGTAAIGNVRAKANTIQTNLSRSTGNEIDAIYVQYVHHTTGCCILRDKNEIPVASGDLLLMDMAEPLEVIHGDYETTSVILPRSTLKSIQVSQNIYPIQLLGTHDPSAIFLRNLLGTLKGQLRYLDTKSVITILQFVGELAVMKLENIELCDVPELQQKSADYLKRLKAKVILRRYLANPDFTGNELAKLMGVSRSTLFRLFINTGGAGQYLKQIRLLKARYLLHHAPHLDVKEISGLCGFKRASGFSRAFRSEFELSPLQVREHMTREETNAMVAYATWILGN